ncbi:MAG: glucose-6-phosphate isomerase, partial [Verrucomicrobiota bacterium]
MASSSFDLYRQQLLNFPELGISLDFSRAPAPAGADARLAPALAKALADMAALERGAIANPDERRMVGHYWLRAPELAPDAQLTAAIAASVEAIAGFAAQVHDGKVKGANGKFTDLLCIGIGGSALGPQFVADALGGKTDRLRVHFIDNTDPDGIDRVFDAL